MMYEIETEKFFREQLKKIENSVDETVAKGNYLLAANLLSEAGERTSNVIF